MQHGDLVTNVFYMNPRLGILWLSEDVSDNIEKLNSLKTCYGSQLVSISQVLVEEAEWDTREYLLDFFSILNGLNRVYVVIDKNLLLTSLLLLIQLDSRVLTQLTGTELSAIMTEAAQTTVIADDFDWFSIPSSIDTVFAEEILGSLSRNSRPESLAAIGAIAELVIEGPTVSKGYYGNLNKTTTAFIHDPPWLLNVPPGYLGRKGRLYLTGDLLRYKSDGQRIELTEVEYHVRSCLQDSSLFDGLAAEIINPQNNNNPLFAVFFSLAKYEGAVEPVEATKTRLIQVMDGLEETLRDRYGSRGLHPHRQDSNDTTNKTDRRSLRELGSALRLEKLAGMQPSARGQRQPSTVMEKRLQMLWASVLDLKPEISKAREQKLSITVADIFKAPRLSEQALLVTEIALVDDAQPLSPFSQLKTDDSEAFLEEFVLLLIESSCGTVRDVIPAPDFQEHSILEALQDPPSRYPHWIFDLPADVDFPTLEQACKKLVTCFDILQTIFIRADNRFWQALLSDLKPEYGVFDAMDEDITAYTDSIFEQDLKRPRQSGRSFIPFIVIKHHSGAHKLVFRISHAQFDGFSWDIVLQSLSSLYRGEYVPSVPSFGQYIAFNETRKEESIRYWTSRLNGVSQPTWSASDPTYHMYEVPVVINIDENDSLPSVASKLQRLFIEDAAYEAVGMVEIIKNRTEWPDEARNFGWRTAFQQADDSELTFLGSPSRIDFYKRDSPPISRPEIYTAPKVRVLELELEVNTQLVPRNIFMDFLAQLRLVLSED
ncbi:hypothetical protein BKA67DRAFT_664519 [Truncatella angustata]|uniref:Condensation domain-containing protein n=1 Tax=Truncatella angustata TaxID=152316 RepID=A0A9P8RG90_9PEZI|nr:uncharacterized protein BKA67DRAFT_664519 [Truncatella angustata]KAH6645444.1 hypothetical protein BKA67DRAFT_664519 [Truncatella angustata]